MIACALCEQFEILGVPAPVSVESWIIMKYLSDYNCTEFNVKASF